MVYNAFILGFLIILINKFGKIISKGMFNFGICNIKWLRFVLFAGKELCQNPLLGNGSLAFVLVILMSTQTEID